MKPLVLLVVLGVIVSSCASSPSTVSTPSLSPSPTPTPTPTPSPTLTATASPFGAAAFRYPDHCTNPLGGYRIAYPDNWYSNAAVANPLNPAAEGIAACQYFAPRDFAVVYGTEPSPDIAIHLALVELPDGVAWDYGPYDGYDVLKDEPARIAGHPARVQVLELLYPDSGYVAVGGRVAQYIVALGKNRYLVGRTTNSTDYRASRRGLADMLRTLVLISH